MKNPGEKHGWRLEIPHCSSSSLQRLDHVERLLQGVDADLVARPARTDGERTVAAMGRLALDDDAQDPDAGRHGRDGERPRERRRLGDDRAVATEPCPHDRARSQVVLHHLLAHHRVQLQLPGQLDPLVLERLGDRPHGRTRALHVRRAEPVETAVAHLRVPGRPRQPGVRLDRRHGVHVSVEDERAPAAAPSADADEVASLRILGHPVRLQAGLLVALPQDLVHARLAAHHVGPRRPREAWG